MNKLTNRAAYWRFFVATCIAVPLVSPPIVTAVDPVEPPAETYRTEAVGTLTNKTKAWDIGQWGAWAECGYWGTQGRSRPVACKGIFDNQSYPDSACTGSKPQHYEQQSCVGYYWEYDGYGTGSCNEYGIRPYRVTSEWCERTDRQRVSDSYCTGSRPSTWSIYTGEGC